MANLRWKNYRENIWCNKHAWFSIIEIFLLPWLLYILTNKRMLAHLFTWSKTIKKGYKIFKKSTFFIIPTRDSWKAHARTWRKMRFLALYFYVSLTWASCAYDEKITFLIFFKRFSLFSTMWTRAQACVCWSKYTTHD